MQQPQDQDSGPVVFLEQTPLDDPQSPVLPFQSLPQVFVRPNEPQGFIEQVQPQEFEGPVFVEPFQPQVLEQVQQVFVEPETVFSQPDVFFRPSQPVSTRPDLVVLPQQQVQPTSFTTFSPQTFSLPQTGQSVFVSSPQPQPTVTVSRPQVGSVFQPRPTVTVSRPQSFQTNFVSDVSSVRVSGQCNFGSGSLVDQVVGNEVWHFSWCHQGRTYTWYQARDYCTSHGQGFSLISVENQVKNSILSAVMSAHGQRTTWTSGNRLTTRRWSWSKAGIQAFYTNWARTGSLGRPQPDNANGDEFCLLVNNSYADGATWHDASCTDNAPVVCQAYRS
ncbi:hypothetical protein Pmani_005172 [Petrolisthes manimaculis]|uniref:C-type lectin domain-containing protein n=1 Tax=Petrolisthes manimaculis TaxID=1843537 RepID=A0AAE1UN63_9EUCA|nr:hypothetical protein Pmani_005172 [Petrolisthes manimaculis]